MNKNLIYLFSLTFLMVGCNSNRIPPTDTKELVNYFDKKGIDIFGSPLSGAILVAKSDSILFKKGIGKVAPKSDQSIDADTKFYIGSLSKQFTASLILLLAQEGKLDLDNSISTYLPSYPEDKGAQITVHHLLSNSSGLPHYPELLKFGYTSKTFFSNPISTKELIDLIGKMNLSFIPGSRFQYSSFGYMLLGAIIENVTKQDYQSVLHNRIVEPLGLKNTGYANELLTENFAADSRFINIPFFRGHYEEVADRELSTAFSAGGIYSSLNDLFTWTQAIRNNSLLNPKFQDLFFKPNLKGYCYGLFKNPEGFLRKNHNVQLYFHGGAIMGYRSAIALYEDETTIIILSNSIPMNNSIRFITQLHLSVFGEEKPVKHFIHPSLRDLPHFYEEGGLADFDLYHEKLSRIAGYTIHPSPGTMKKVITMHLEDKDYKLIIKEHIQGYLSAHPDLPEELINAIGYAYLEMNELDEARIIFKENISRYPNSPNVYDSLGEVLELKGEYDLAKLNYAKAVKLAKIQKDLSLDIYQSNLDRLSE